ncbi:MAG TPA: rhodanese-like domain-containing protein [Alteraurantiacibacter sp.]|jgi:hypothetical protein
MPAFRTALAALALLGASTASAQETAPPPDNPLIDYAGFVALAAELGDVREAHRIGWDEFAAKSRESGTIVLDTRSVSAFRMGHIEGAVNLPFSDFTDAKLAKVLGPDRNRPILIYCNNNFSDNVAPVLTKKVELALNIPTFINLHGYGYTNVWELADVMSIADARIAWTGSFAAAAAQAGQ